MPLRRPYIVLVWPLTGKFEPPQPTPTHHRLRYSVALSRTIYGMQWCEYFCWNRRPMSRTIGSKVHNCFSWIRLPMTRTISSKVHERSSQLVPLGRNMLWGKNQRNQVNLLGFIYPRTNCQSYYCSWHLLGSNHRILRTLRNVRRTNARTERKPPRCRIPLWTNSFPNIIFHTNRTGLKEIRTIFFIFFNKIKIFFINTQLLEKGNYIIRFNWYIKLYMV